METSLINAETDVLLTVANKKSEERKFNEAIEIYKTVISKNDKSFDTYSRLGAIYERIRDVINAKEVYKKALTKAKELQEKAWEREFSYILLGLVD